MRSSEVTSALPSAFVLSTMLLPLRGIDTYSAGEIIARTLYIEFLVVSVGIFLFTYFQGIFQTYLSERVALDLRERLADKISRMSFLRLEKETPSKLLTNLTSDINSVKTFLSMGVSAVIYSVLIIIGASILLIMINWKLALAVLALLPILGILFGVVFKKLGPFFTEAQKVIDRFNTVIGQTIVGAATVRVLDSATEEHARFKVENDFARENGMKILKYFAIIIPIIGIVANLASLVILSLGGHYVILGSMSVGDFTAFNGYVFILIFPIIMLGFVTSIISQAQASYARISEVLGLPNETEDGTLSSEIKGDLEVKNLSHSYGEKKVLDNISFSLKAGTKTAIIGPTAAGKTELLHALIGLTHPKEGEILYDGKALASYSREAIHSQVALVFQDSVMFNLSIRENIAFSPTANEVEIAKAIETAELKDFIDDLSKGLDTVVSERGTSLSGGQKQRIMLARALALNPKILFLDDFTARVDAQTEKKILANVEKNYPNLTLVSVTQKIQSVEHFDKIILLMEGEIIAQGTHKELSETSPEYVQIMESQKSTETYEK